jgi:hypothetical protein
MGTAATNESYNHKEFKNRIYFGNACYHLVQNLLSSHLISKTLKIKVYKTITLSVVYMGVKLDLSPLEKNINLEYLRMKR